MKYNDPKKLIEDVNFQLGEHAFLNFACFHDNMFVFEAVVKNTELVAELTFFIVEDGYFTDHETIQDLVKSIDFSMYCDFHLLMNDETIEDINLNDLGI